METQYLVATSGDPTFEQLPAVKVMQAFIDAVQRGDTAKAKGLLTDDVVMTIHGKSLLSGEHRGADGVINLLSRLNELSGGTHNIVGTMAWMVHENHIHTVVAETPTRNGKTLHYNRALVFEVQDGKIAMGQSFEDDQYAFDAFWS
ncbi:nuclear transport factor 2 family protein [Spirosoma arcticum]